MHTSQVFGKVGTAMRRFRGSRFRAIRGFRASFEISRLERRDVTLCFGMCFH
jgi:hypothetical protein